MLATVEELELGAGVMDPVGRGSTQAGMILGLIDTILSSLGVLVVLVLMLGFGVAICSVVGTGG